MRIIRSGMEPPESFHYTSAAAVVGRCILGARHRNGDLRAFFFCGSDLNVYDTFSTGGSHATFPGSTRTGKTRSAAHPLRTWRPAPWLDYRHRPSLRKTNLSLCPTR